MNIDLQKFEMQRTTLEIKPKLNGSRKNKAEFTIDGGEKRKRSSNFHTQEIEDLLSLIDAEKTIIECKRTDQLTNSYKDKTWKKISHNFNKKNVTRRSDKQLRSKWETLKKIARKEYSSGNLSAVSNNVVKIMLSCNGMEMNFNSVNPIHLKEEPFFHYDNENDINDESCYEEMVSQEVIQSEIAHNPQEQVNNTRNQDKEKIMGTVLGINESRPENLMNHSTISRIYEELTHPQISTVCMLSRATQYDLQDLEEEQDEDKFHRNVVVKKRNSQNFERMFYCAENRRKKEKHSLEMKILRVELAIKTRQLENLRR